MIVEETFFRPPELSREPRRLPAETYNLAHVLFKRTTTGCLFVPIRSMQFLAVLDGEEFIFVDHEGGRMIELAWRHFKPQERDSLAEPVSYEVVYYSPAAAEIMRRIQGEFHKALCALEQKTVLDGRARVIPLSSKSR